jgi:hypothetical protein
MTQSLGRPERRFGYVGLWALATTLVACGGSTGSPLGAPDSGAVTEDAAATLDAGGGAGTDGGAVADGSTTLPDGATQDAAVGPGACPAALPAIGGACTGTLECEYGSAPDVSCDTVVECSAGSWAAKSSPSGASCQAAPNPAACPSSYATLVTQTSCTPEGTACDYPEANCTCATQCQMVGSMTLFWCCPDAPSSVPGCPTIRPRIGSACATPEATCDYGGCSGNVTLQCSSDGTWQPIMTACPG